MADKGRSKAGKTPGGRNYSTFNSNGVRITTVSESSKGKLKHFTKSSGKFVGGKTDVDKTVTSFSDKGMRSSVIKKGPTKSVKKK